MAIEKSKLSLGIGVEGQNLNTRVFRGFANLALLSKISAPDPFDQITNEAGVQRTPSSAHAKKALQYALGSMQIGADQEARAFTEVILNVRDVSVFDLKSLVTKGTSTSGKAKKYGSSSGAYELFIDPDAIIRLAMKGKIAVSRIDGNHRLFWAEKLLELGEVSEASFPTVPFALFMGLSLQQERKLFGDINGKQKPVTRSLLGWFDILNSNETIIEDRDELANRIAGELCRSGRSFGNLVNISGSVATYKKKYGFAPPTSLVGLKNAFKVMLAVSGNWAEKQGYDSVSMAEWVDQYFRTLIKVFPEEWHNPTPYVLLKSTGLSGFAKLAGAIFSKLASENQEIDTQRLEKMLRAIKREIDLDKFAWAGRTGFGAIDMFYTNLLQILRNNGYASDLPGPR